MSPTASSRTRWPREQPSHEPPEQQKQEHERSNSCHWRQARQVWAALAERLEGVGLRLHPDKTKIVYCKDSNRRADFEGTSFTFLGYTFRPRESKAGKGGKIFTSFQPAISPVALKAKSQKGNHPGYVLARRLADKADQVWLWTHNFAVPWTNNASERALKSPKLHQKVSGYWHTLATATRFCRVRSYLTSSRNHGIRPIDAIHAALTGNPWLPTPA